MGQQAEKRFHLLLLLGWFLLGLSLRLSALTAKTPWTDEFSTMVFSLGHGFTSVPLDRAIAISTLMQPLQPYPPTQASDVITRLLSESNHPPVYFVLAHWWMKLFPITDESSLLMAARLLPALLGGLSIPAMFGLSWVAFRSRLMAQTSAMMMAVSPYAIFLAQEARHYTLSILLAIASCTCFIRAVRYLHQRQPLPLQIALTWIALNWLGIATHYFFSLTLAAQGIVLLGVGWQQRPLKLKLLPSWILTGVATLIGGLIWLPLWRNGLGSELTAWITQDSRTGFEWLQPIFQLIAAWLTMLSLLPVEADRLGVILLSGALMICFFVWVLPILWRSLQALLKVPTTQLATGSFVGFVVGAIALFFAITYFLGIDLTRGARYNFVYFPGVILLVGSCLALCWNSPQVTSQWFHFPAWKTQGKIAVIVVALMGLASSLTVVTNLGYQKYYRPDRLVPLMVSARSVDAQNAALLVATTHRTHVQIGEMMGIAWEFKRQQVPLQPQFLLAHETQDSSQVLKQTLTQLPRPLDLWLVNFKVPVELESQNCSADPAFVSPVDGYEAQFYRCR